VRCVLTDGGTVNKRIRNDCRCRWTDASDDPEGETDRAIGLPPLRPSHGMPISLRLEVNDGHSHRKRTEKVKTKEKSTDQTKGKRKRKRKRESCHNRLPSHLMSQFGDPECIRSQRCQSLDLSARQSYRSQTGGEGGRTPRSENDHDVAELAGTIISMFPSIINQQWTRKTRKTRNICW